MYTTAKNLSQNYTYNYKWKHTLCLLVLQIAVLISRSCLSAIFYGLLGHTSAQLVQFFKVVSAMALIWQTQTVLISSNQTISYCLYRADLGIKQMDSTVKDAFKIWIFDGCNLHCCIYWPQCCIYWPQCCIFHQCFVLWMHCYMEIN